MFGTKKSTTPTADERIRKQLDEHQVRYEVTDDGDLEVGLELENGRTQVAFIRSATYEFLGIEIREISSVALVSEGSFDARTANILLQQNSDIAIGVWGVLSDNADRHAAIFCAKVSAEIPANELFGVLRAVLEVADHMEARLSGRDDF